MTTNLKLAIKNFQRFVGLRVDGIIGPSTHKAMTSFNNCTQAVEAELIECSGYLAYKECTFFMNEIFEVSSEPAPVTTATPVCNDETFQPHRLSHSSKKQEFKIAKIAKHSNVHKVLTLATGASSPVAR